MARRGSLLCHLREECSLSVLRTSFSPVDWATSHNVFTRNGLMMSGTQQCPAAGSCTLTHVVSLSNSLLNEHWMGHHRHTVECSSYTCEYGRRLRRIFLG